ncbi:Formamidopyrimidine-DNA glycosylase [Bienertia sinuspersici]
MAGDLLYEKSSTCGATSVGNRITTTTIGEAKREHERLQVEKEKLEETRKMNEYLAKMKRTMQDYRDASCSVRFFSFARSKRPIRCRICNVLITINWMGRQALLDD